MKTFLTIIFIGTLAIGRAQWDEHNALYAEGGFGGGDYFNSHGSVNYVSESRYSIQVGVVKGVRRAPNLPSDYFGGLLSFGSNTPRDVHSTRYFLAGIGCASTSKTVRLNFRAGLGITELKEPVNFEKLSSGDIFSENYTYDFSRTSALSLVIRPSIEFAFCRSFGLSISPHAVVNRHEVTAGFSINFMVGLLRGEKPGVVNE